MAVTVQMKDRVAATAPPPVDLSDFAHPREKAEGVKALAIWLLVPVLLGVLLAVFQHPALLLLLLWWIVAAIGFLRIGPSQTLAKLRKLGPEAKITQKTAPRLATVLAKAPGALGIAPVEGFIAPESVPQARIGGPPLFFKTTTGARDLVSPAELDCLTLRSLVHIRQGHARRLFLLQAVGDLPLAWRVLAWPVTIYATLLRVAWLDAAEQTTDRLTLLLIKNRDVLLGAILKLHASGDLTMQDANISAQDVDSYLKGSGAIGSEGKEISTQFRLGSAINDNPYLNARIDALMNWSRSPECAAALQKLSGAAPAKDAPNATSGTNPPRAASVSR